MLEMILYYTFDYIQDEVDTFIEGKFRRSDTIVEFMKKIIKK